MTAYRPSARAVVAVAILIAWGVSLSWLGFRRLDASAGSQLALIASQRLAPGEARFALYAGDTQVGSAGITLDTLSPGYRIVETMTLETPGGTGLVRGVHYVETLLDPDLHLREVNSRYVRAGRRVLGRLLVEGQVLTFRGYGTTGTMRLSGPTRAAPVVALPYRLALARGGFTGDNSTFPMTTGGWPAAVRTTPVNSTGLDSVAIFPDSSVLEPSGARWVPAHFDTTRVYNVVVTGPAGPYEMWVERTGTVVAIIYPLGVRWIRTDFDLAVSNFRRQLTAQGDSTIVAALPRLAPWVTPGTTVDTSTRERRFRVTRANGAPIRSRALVKLWADRQEVRGDTIIVRRDSHRSSRGAVADVTLDPLVQHDAAPIAAFARELGLTRYDTTAAATIANAIARRITLDTSYAASIDALTTLRDRRGRADGMARLFVAVARAIDIPARYVTGFTIVGGTLRTHAWAEIWDHRNGWYGIDPVTGAANASTALIRLGFAGSSHPEDLIPILADVRLTDLNATGTPQ